MGPREIWDLTDKIIKGALVVHSELGPGLLESAYEKCLSKVLIDSALKVRRQVEVPLKFRGEVIDCGFRLDMLVEDSVIVELKSVEAVSHLHIAQALTYLRLAKMPVCLLINFNVPHLRQGGIRRLDRRSSPLFPPILQIPFDPPTKSS